MVLTLLTSQLILCMVMYLSLMICIQSITWQRKIKIKMDGSMINILSIIDMFYFPGTPSDLKNVEVFLSLN